MKPVVVISKLANLRQRAAEAGREFKDGNLPSSACEERYLPSVIFEYHERLRALYEAGKLVSVNKVKHCGGCDECKGGRR